MFNSVQPEMFHLYSKCEENINSYLFRKLRLCYKSVFAQCFKLACAFQCQNSETRVSSRTLSLCTCKQLRSIIHVFETH